MLRALAKYTSQGQVDEQTNRVGILFYRLGFLLSGHLDRPFHVAQVGFRALHNALRLDRLCARPAGYDIQHLVFDWGVDLVTVGRGIHISCMGNLRLPRRLPPKDTLAQPDQLADFRSLRDPLPGHCHVLLVAAWVDRSVVLDGIRWPVRRKYDPERYFAPNSGWLNKQSER